MSRFSPWRSLYDISTHWACTQGVYIYVCIYINPHSTIHILREESGRRALRLKLKTTSLFSLKHDCRNQKHKCLKALAAAAAAIKNRAERNTRPSHAAPTSPERRVGAKKEKQDLPIRRQQSCSDGRIVKWHVILKRVLSLSRPLLDYMISKQAWE